MNYIKTEWKNRGEPGDKTPINAGNLNKIEEAIEDIIDTITDIETTINESDISTLYTSGSYKVIPTNTNSLPYYLLVLQNGIGAQETNYYTQIKFEDNSAFGIKCPIFYRYSRPPHPPYGYGNWIQIVDYEEMAAIYSEIYDITTELNAIVLDTEDTPDTVVKRDENGKIKIDSIPEIPLANKAKDYDENNGGIKDKFEEVKQYTDLKTTIETDVNIDGKTYSTLVLVNQDENGFYLSEDGQGTHIICYSPIGPFITPFSHGSSGYGASLTTTDTSPAAMILDIPLSGCLTLAPNSLKTFVIIISATGSDPIKYGSWKLECAAKRNIEANSISILDTIVKTIIYADIGLDVDINEDITTGSLKIDVTGLESTIKWKAQIEFVEII